MDRRAFLGALGLLAPPFAAEAQQQTQLQRVGLLTPAASSAVRDVWQAFRGGLRELGWHEGRNIVVEYRSAEGEFQRLPALAAELVDLKVAVLVSANSPGTRAAMNATKTIPIVMVAVGDPVATGFVTNLARPGGNVTGVTNSARDLTRKRLELLKETVATASRIAVIMNTDDPIVPPQVEELRAAGRALGLNLQFVEARKAADLDAAFAMILRGRADALFRLADPLNTALRARTVEFTLKHRLPAMMVLRQDVEAGGLIAYFTDHIAHYRRAATYVDRILRGAKPADLPIEQPTKFDLAINLKTAKALGLTIPPSLLQRADQVLE